MRDSLRESLRRLALALGECEQHALAAMVELAAKGSDTEMEAFLKSNDLWGGSGSVADQAGLPGGREARRRVESALIELGQAQVTSGVVNVRTEPWVAAFLEWRAHGI